MAQTLPLNIPIPQSAAIASFNYADIAEGTGIVKYYLAEHSEAGTAAYYLTTNTPFSNKVTLSGLNVAAGTEWSIDVIDKDFDVKFNRPQNIKGKAYLSFSMGGNANTVGGQLIKASGLQIIKYDGSTETVLATASSDTLTCVSTGNETGTFLVEFDLTGGPYHFKVGDTLRLSMKMSGKPAATGALDYEGFGIDPQDRNDPNATQTIADAYTTKAEFYVPFLLNTT